MAVEIPIVADTPDFDFAVDLDGVTFTLRLTWNERDAGWYLAFSTAEEEPIVDGVRVVVDLPLLNRFTDPRLPTGALLAVDTSGAGADPGLDDLGFERRVRLLYFPRAELQA